MALHRSRNRFSSRVSSNVRSIVIDLPPIGGIDLPPFEIGGGGGGGGGPVSGGFPCSFGFEPVTNSAGQTTCVPIGQGGGFDPFDPIINPPGFGPTSPADCGIGMSPDPITGECRLDLDPGPGQGFPGNGAAGGGGLTRPARICRNTFVCPRFADGKTGILWMNALTGDVVCLPRRTNGKGFGLIRKNKPRKPAFISAGAKASLTKMKAVQKKAKSFAEDAGFTCKKR